MKRKKRKHKNQMGREEKTVFDDYDDMRETLNNQVPEILESARYMEMIDFWGNEEIPMYFYYENLEHLFIDLLDGKIKDAGLLGRVLDFMENMANSKDGGVQNLLHVQILEGLFGLERDVFISMEKMLGPKTKEILETVKTGFYEPNGYVPIKTSSQNPKRKKRKRPK